MRFASVHPLNREDGGKRVWSGAVQAAGPIPTFFGMDVKIESNRYSLTATSWKVQIRRASHIWQRGMQGVLIYDASGRPFPPVASSSKPDLMIQSPTRNRNPFAPTSRSFLFYSLARLSSLLELMYVALNFSTSAILDSFLGQVPGVFCVIINVCAVVR